MLQKTIDFSNICYRSSYICIMQKPLNEKEQKILDFLHQEVIEKGYPPSVREICKAVGFKSTSTVHGYLEKLEKYGYLVKDPAKPRALKIFGRKNTLINGPNSSEIPVYNIPIIGKVTAGQPILAIENQEGVFPVPMDYLGTDKCFMLKVSGESMIDAGILDGDFIIVRQQSDAQNGDIVVAMINDEATVKTFYKEDSVVRLQPRNKFLEPIYTTDVSILGKVIGVFRKM